ncbi:hypothetical protein C8J57DRAFT_1500087 [Mycena rebaudengoi]|nr:hypothetical protein C8J57DRAFT_1500087 [Mycena rebaudengoi]
MGETLLLIPNAHQHSPSFSNTTAYQQPTGMNILRLVLSFITLVLWPLTVLLPLLARVFSSKDVFVNLSYALFVSQLEASELQAAINMLRHSSAAIAQEFATVRLNTQLVLTVSALKAALAAVVKKGRDDMASMLNTLGEAKALICILKQKVADKDAIVDKQAQRITSLLRLADVSKSRLLGELNTVKQKAKEESDKALWKLAEQLAAKDAALKAQGRLLADTIAAADAARSKHAASLATRNTKISADAARISKQATEIKSLHAKLANLEDRGTADGKTIKKQAAKIEALETSVKTLVAEALASKKVKEDEAIASASHLRKQKRKVSGLQARVKKLEEEAEEAEAQKLKLERIIKVAERRAVKAEERVVELEAVQVQLQVIKIDQATATGVEDHIDLGYPPIAEEEAVVCSSAAEQDIDMIGAPGEPAPFSQPARWTHPWHFAPLFVVRSDSKFAQASVSEPGRIVQREGRKVVGRGGRSAVTPLLLPAWPGCQEREEDGRSPKRVRML